MRGSTTTTVTSSETLDPRWTDQDILAAVGRLKADATKDLDVVLAVAPAAAPPTVEYEIVVRAIGHTSFGGSDPE